MYVITNERLVDVFIDSVNNSVDDLFALHETVVLELNI